MIDEARLRDRILGHLQELGDGRCSLTEDGVEREADPGARELLRGVLALHRELEGRRSRDHARPLQRSNDELARANAELAEANARLQQTNRDLEQFAYVASHDLQAPLRMVAGFADLIATRCKEQLDDNTMTYIYKLLSGTERMQRLVNGLLKVSQLDSRGMTIQTVDCNEILADIVEVLQPELIAAGGQLRVEELPSVEGDAVQLTQLFQNLVQNAIKFRGEAPLRITVDAGVDDRAATFRVCDNGRGFAAQQAERIFEMFTRLVSADERAGSGLGLAIVHKIAERHGGRAWAEGKPGAGATFYVQLPLKSPRAPARAHPAC